MFFRLLHAIRRRQIWLLAGVAFLVLAALAYSGSGIDRAFAGDPSELLFAALGGLCFAVAGYWLSRSLYNVMKPARFLGPIALGLILWSVGDVMDWQAVLQGKVGAPLFGALIVLVVSALGVARMLGYPKSGSGHFSRGNQPGA